MNINMTPKDDVNPEVEQIESLQPMDPQQHTPGTVRLFDHKSVVLIPTPSPDPKDPLNLPAWRKYLIIFLIGVYSAFAVAGTSALGAVFPEVEAMYPPSEATRATDLLTYPTLFMGIGNLISMPLCVSLGRRPVFLMSLALLVVSGIWCAASKSLTSHIAARDIFSMAAGQSEALAPMIIQEIHFLHERGTKVAWFVAVQSVGTAAMFVATTYIVPSWGIRWWYGIITIVNGFLLVLSFFFIVESRFDRPEDAVEGEVHLHFDNQGKIIQRGGFEKIVKVTTAETHVLEPEKYGPRSWRDDLKIFHFKPDWNETIQFYKETIQGLVVPSMLWLVLLNGAYLGVYVYQASTFAQVLVATPYSFKESWVGFVQMSQIVDCALMVPLLGYGSDYVVRVMSRIHKGVFEPEYRLIPLTIPAIGVICSCVIFGQAAQHPDKWSWAAVAIPYLLGYFAFLGANLVGITYAVDSFPHKAGPLLLLICAGRGFISFGLSYSTVPFIASQGYNGSMNVFAIICGILSGFGVVVYFTGKYMRVWVQKKLWPIDN